MSRTKHHRSDSHAGDEFGGRYNCNKHYNLGYGKKGRKVAHKEMREDAKQQIRNSEG